jgi:excisionase family DNA binding protein
MNGGDPHNDEAIRLQIEADMERLQIKEEMEWFQHLPEEEKERLRAMYPGDLRRCLEESRQLRLAQLITPEERERFQREFMAEVFRRCDPESQAALRQLAVAMPLSNTQESLRKELTETRDRTARISSTLKQQTGKAPRIKRPRSTGRMLTVKQMAEALTLSSDVVYKMCEAGEIPGVKRMPTGAKRNKTWRADAVIFERWRTSPDRRRR